MKEKIVKLIIIIFYLIICIYIVNFSLDNNKKVTYDTKVKSYINIKMLKIPKIELFLKVNKATTNFDNLDYGLVYYKNFNPDNKIIIFGHSGMGTGTYFNRLSELKKKDVAYLIHNNIEYKYIVNSVYDISKKDVYILYDEMDSKKLLLITCLKNNKNRRLVVEFAMESMKTIEK